VSEVVAPRSFQIGEAIRFGWERFKENIGPLAIAALAVLAVNLLFNLLQASVTGRFGRFLVALLSFFVSQIVAMGWLRMSLNIVDGRPADVSDFFQRADLFIPYVIASFIFSVVVAIGLVLLIVPGLYALATFCYYGFRIIDVERNATEALSDSATITRGERWHILGFIGVLLLLNILGVLLLIVGVVVTLGISLIATAYVYRQLAGPPGS
jgi:uncharacterized membrane protein